MNSHLSSAETKNIFSIVQNSMISCVLNTSFFWFENKLNMFFSYYEYDTCQQFFIFFNSSFFSNDQLGAYLKSIRQSFYPEKMCRKIVIHILPLVNKTKKLFYFIQSFRFFSFGWFGFQFWHCFPVWFVVLRIL